ncbi:unnamed protein product, partial [Prorocentrum cordatum]
GGGGGGGMSPEDLFEAFFAQAGGHPFARGGGMGGMGGPRVVFSSGGLGGNVFHFSSMGGGSGFGAHPGLRRRAGGGPQQRREAGEDDERPEEPVPAWLTALQ